MEDTKARIQSWFRKLSTYQSFPENLIQTKIQFYFREITSFFIRIILFRRRYPFTKEFEKLKNAKGRFASSTAIVLGNGPSLTSIDSNRLKSKQKGSFYICVMNDFYRSALAKEITPSFYFISDPAYWHNQKSIELLRRYLERNTDIVVIQPSYHPNFSDKNETLHFRPFQLHGFGHFENPLGLWSLPQSIALFALATCKYLGFREILFAGLDSSHWRSFYVDELNNLFLDLSKAYGLGTVNAGTEDQDERLYNSSWTVVDMRDVLYAAAIYLKDFARLSNGKFINIGDDSSNDSSPKACLL